jgi:hypothetical protein
MMHGQQIVKDSWRATDLNFQKYHYETTTSRNVGN